MDRETGKCKGYGFCEYADHATALSAMRNLNGYDIGGRNLRVDFAAGGTGDKSSSSSAQPIKAAKAERKEKKKGSMSPAELQTAIDTAVEAQGPVELLDALVEFQEFSRKNPQHARIILDAHPALAQSIIQAFDMFDLPTEGKITTIVRLVATTE